MSYQLGCIFMMTAAASFLWEHIRLLHRLQFPWRLLTLVTVLGAISAGAMLPWRRDPLRAAAVALVIAIALFLSGGYTAHMRAPRWKNPANVAEIRSIYVAPDPRDEWMPRGANVDARSRIASLPSGGPGARIADFELHQGLMRAVVKARRDSFVILPHYWFPVGWSASVEGRPVTLGRDRDGLMRVFLPAGTEGALEVRFSRTPMRAGGLMVSAATVLFALGLLARARVRTGGRTS